MVLVQLLPVVILVLCGKFGQGLLHVKGRPVQGILLVLGLHLGIRSGHVVDKGCLGHDLVAAVRHGLSVGVRKLVEAVHHIVLLIIAPVGGHVAVAVDLTAQLHDSPVVLVSLFVLDHAALKGVEHDLHLARILDAAAAVSLLIPDGVRDHGPIAACPRL